MVTQCSQAAASNKARYLSSSPIYPPLSRRSNSEKLTRFVSHFLCNQKVTEEFRKQHEFFLLSWNLTCQFRTNILSLEHIQCNWREKLLNGIFVHFGASQETAHCYPQNVDRCCTSHVQRRPHVVAGISARFSKFSFVLFCYITNHLMK